MFPDEWPIYSAINRREYKEAQRKLSQLYREAVDAMTVADKWVDRVTRAEFAGNGITRSESMRDGVGGTAAGTRGLAEVAGSRAIIQGLIEQINERISMITDRQDASQRAIERLINPRPANVASDKVGVPPREPTSVEDHLNAILHRLDYVVRSASDQADQLNSAV